MLTPAFASILRSGRSDFNERFAAARHTYSDLRPETFSEFLETRVNDLIVAVDQTKSDRVAEVVMASYDAGLLLVGQRLAGPGARLSTIDEGWNRLFPEIPSLVANAPERVIPAVCNAIYQLASAPQARPMQWIDTMRRLGPRCSDVDEFLKLGQVAAWHAGLAHLRSGALRVANELPVELVSEALQSDSNDWQNIRARLETDPWFDPTSPNDSNKLRLVARIGAFRGFGGLFVKPPFVASCGEHFLARCDDECWLITADAFGATFHRATKDEFQAAVQQLPKDLKISSGKISLNGETVAVPETQTITSAAANSTTLALSSKLSHSIVLVALP